MNLAGCIIGAASAHSAIASREADRRHNEVLAAIRDQPRLAEEARIRRLQNEDHGGTDIPGLLEMPLDQAGRYILYGVKPFNCSHRPIGPSVNDDLDAMTARSMYAAEAQERLERENPRHVKREKPPSVLAFAALALLIFVVWLVS